MAENPTNAQEVFIERLTDAKKHVEDLQKWLPSVYKAMERTIAANDGNAFPVSWTTPIIEKANAILAEVSRANGAILVQAKSVLGACG